MENNENKIKIGEKKYLPTIEFYSQILDSIKDYSIFTLDNELKINSWNNGSEKIFGYTEDEAIGKQFNLIFTGKDLENDIPQQEIDKSLKEGRSSDKRWHVTKYESLFFADGLIFPLIDLNGERIGFVKILQNISELKESEDSIKNYVLELEELYAHKDRVIATLSHDLRSPLTTVLGIADYLRLNFDTINQAEFKEFLEIIYKLTKNEITSFDNLLEWARIKYASEIFSPGNVKLIDYIKIVFDNLGKTASLKSINLYHEIGEDIFVFADVQMLISIIQNIISNAIKHTGKGGTIIISANKSEDSIIIQVKDNGSGMSKEILEKLFTPQISTLSKARVENKGAGIGLLLVKGFLEKNGGKIWVESIEGVGSSFYFTLPVENPVSKIPTSDNDIFHEWAYPRKNII